MTVYVAVYVAVYMAVYGRFNCTLFSWLSLIALSTFSSGMSPSPPLSDIVRSNTLFRCSERGYS